MSRPSTRTPWGPVTTRSTWPSSASRTMDDQLMSRRRNLSDRRVATDRRAPKAVSVARGFLAALVALYAVASLTGLSESLLPRSATHVIGGGLLIAAAAICAARS